MQNFSEYVSDLKRKVKSLKEETVFVCIGSNDVIWDSIGPYVGSFLKKKIGEKYVVGDLENNICCKKDFLHYYPKVKDKFIVAIDSAIAKKELQGEIFITEKPIIMGLGMNRNKGIIGNLSIKVAIDRRLTNKKYVIEISKLVARGIYFCYKN